MDCHSELRTAGHALHVTHVHQGRVHGVSDQTRCAGGHIVHQRNTSINQSQGGSVDAGAVVTSISLQQQSEISIVVCQPIREEYYLQHLNVDINLRPGVQLHLDCSLECLFQVLRHLQTLPVSPGSVLPLPGAEHCHAVLTINNNSETMLSCDWSVDDDTEL